MGVGGFAATRAEEALKKTEMGLKDVNLKIVRVLHPSPASPESNSDWGGKATRQMQDQGIW